MEADAPGTGSRASRGTASGRSALPLAVVSNRLPFTLHRTGGGLEARCSTGGLVSALEPVLSCRGGTWVGWPGIELREQERLPLLELPYRVRPVALRESDAARYYHGFSNRALWPLFHCLLERARFEPREWTAYERVNVRFAEVAAEACEDAAFMWIHDYHLLRAPRHLRRLVPTARVALFLHTPFPPFDVFRVLPWTREILRGMLSCDLVGFHIPSYAHNFLDCAERILGARVDRTVMLVEEGDRTVRVGAFPLGIDFARFEAFARSAPVPPGDRERVILGIDRLDYTKGIPERMRAFERLLECYPRYREEVTLVQVTVPSRAQVAEYRVLKRDIDEIVGRINGRFATATWSPIRYLYQEVPIETLAALYRDADVALVTPLRDGMNLVAKEFVACQVHDPGVLILSRLAGTAETMHEAICVNPYNVDSTAAALHRALTMDEAERASRNLALRRREQRDNVYAWVERFCDAALASPAGLRPPTSDDFEAWLGPFQRGYRIALFIDYDGTLTPLRDYPSEAILSPRARRALQLCARRPDTEVTIMSGRSAEDMQRLIDDPRITLAAHDGLDITGGDLPPFRHPDLVHYEARVAALAKELALQDAAGAWTEAKGPTITFHYRQAPRSQHESLAAQARAVITRAGFQARDTHSAVEARPPIGFDRGQAVLQILRTRHGPAWSERVRVVYVGDDVADEDAFRLFAGLAKTFRVGSAETQTLAARRLRNVEAVEALIEWLAHRDSTVPDPDPEPRAGRKPRRSVRV
jgi:trehalose 6-phosphate synthase/phosphatase